MYLAGNSLGGFVAASVATHYPELCRGVRCEASACKRAVMHARCDIQCHRSLLTRKLHLNPSWLLQVVFLNATPWWAFNKPTGEIAAKVVTAGGGVVGQAAVAAADVR